MGRKGGKRGGGGGGGGYEDQYGEGFQSQDRSERQGFGGRGGGSTGSFSGGGEAGGGKKDSNVSYIRSVPKFLQGHMHLLGHKESQEQQEQPQLHEVSREVEDDSGEEDEKEALERAVAQDLSLAEQYPELQSVADRVRATEAKEAGNRAFSDKRYEEAIQHFSAAIELDKQNQVFFSNRAAAYQALKLHNKALDDARQVIKLQPGWAKGWSRLGAAHFALEEFAEAREAYEKACQLEPSDRFLEDMRHKSEVNEHKQESDRVVKFKRRATQAGNEKKKGKSNATAGAGVKNRTLLSFDNDDV